MPQTPHHTRCNDIDTFPCSVSWIDDRNFDIDTVPASGSCIDDRNINIDTVLARVSCIGDRNIDISTISMKNGNHTESHQKDAASHTSEDTSCWPPVK